MFSYLSLPHSLQISNKIPRTGNTESQGDYLDAFWIVHDRDLYIADYISDFDEGSFVKLSMVELHPGPQQYVAVTLMPFILEQGTAFLWLVELRPD